MNDLPSTRLEIDLQALEHNFTYFKNKLKKDTKIIAAVKANAYGTDAVTVAKKLETLQVDYLAVVFTREGVALRKAGVKTPILVFQSNPSEISQIVEYHLEPSLYSDTMFRAFSVYAEENELTEYPVHVKFNTGMNRLGMALSQAESLGMAFAANNNLKLESIFTHFAASDAIVEKKFTQQQIEKFVRVSKELENMLGYMPLRHLCNTMGVINYPEAFFDAVRLGMGLHGYTYDKHTNKKLKIVSSLYAPIIQKQYLNAGDSVSYSRTFIAKEPMVIATIPLGHADGIHRVYGNGKGWVYLNGRKAPILGNICMDMFMIDVTEIACDEGDMVEVFGKHNDVMDLALSGKTIFYELLSGISDRVPRCLI